MKFVTGLPLTPAERERFEAQKREAQQREFARKKARRSGQRYNKPMARGHRESYDRMVGSA